MSDWSAIVVNHNGGSDLVECVARLQKQSPSPEVLIVDNRSTDGSLDAIRERFSFAKIVEAPRNLGFAAGANLGASLATGEHLLFLNPDLFIEDGCMDGLAEALQTAGAAGPALFVEASDQEEYGGLVDWFGYPEPLTTPGRPTYVPGCALATKASLFGELGGFDERYFMFVEDIDYCLRVLLSGNDVVTVPQARAFHKGGAATAGGYGKRGEIKTPTVFRFTMRERNSLAMITKCAPVVWLSVLIPLYISQSLVTAVAALFLKPAVSVGIFKGLWWNAVYLGETLRRRRAIPKSPVGRKLLRGRVRPGSNKLKIVMRQGLPRFISESKRA